VFQNNVTVRNWKANERKKKAAMHPSRLTDPVVTLNGVKDCTGLSLLGHASSE
jgi:hypothetical protein